MHWGHKGFWTLLEKLAGRLTDGQQPWLSYKQPPPSLPPVYPSKRLAPIHHNSSQHFSIQYWYYTDKWTWSRRFSCNDSGGAISKAGERKRKGYCIDFNSNLPSSPYMHHLSTHILRSYCHIYRKMGNATRVDRGPVYMESHIVHFPPSAPGWYYIQSLPLHTYVNMFGLHWEECALRLPYKISRPFPCWLPFMPPLAKRPTPLYQ